MLLVALIAASLAVLSGCGLSADAEPREIGVGSLPLELRPGQIPTATPQAPSAQGPGREQVHMIRDGRLVTVERQIVDDPDRLLEILLQNTFPGEAADGITSAIFRGTRVQDLEVNELLDLAIVDLAPGSLNPVGSEQRFAFAQIVYTLTSLPGIESVTFVQTDPSDPDLETVPLPVQTDTGTTVPGARVTRADFARIEPLPALAEPAFDIPTPTPVDPLAPPLSSTRVWMIDESSKLVPVERQLDASADAYLVSVIEGPTTEEFRDRGLRSAIPPDALPESVQISEYTVVRTDEFGQETVAEQNIAIVSMDTGSLPAESTPGDPEDARLLAVAQIVFTLTELDTVDQVAFLIDGEPILMPTDDGLILPFNPSSPRGLDRADFLEQLSATTPGSTPVPIVEPTPTPP